MEQITLEVQSGRVTRAIGPVIKEYLIPMPILLVNGAENFPLVVNTFKEEEPYLSPEERIAMGKAFAKFIYTRVPFDFAEAMFVEYRDNFRQL